MNQHVKHGAIAAMLTLASVVSHLLPHMMGITTIGAVGMLAAAYLPRGYALIPVLVTVTIGNAVMGFYAPIAMGIVYLAHVAAVLSVRGMLGTVGIKTVGLAAIVNAVVFYLISNTVPIAMAFQPNTLEGWTITYTLGLPFLLKHIVANLAFGGLAFGLIAWIGASRMQPKAIGQRD